MQVSMMQQQIRLGVRVNALDATPVGTTNTGIAEWIGAAVANPLSRLPNADWLTLTTTAAAGTSFKFVRKGIYAFDVTIPLVAGELTAVMIAGSLNATSLLAAGVTPAIAVVSYEDFHYTTGIAAMFTSLKLNFTVSILNTQRSSGTYATTAPVGTSPLGTVRIHMGDGAEAAVTAASVDVANASLRISDVAEIFG
jgi:hypothetical protein